MTQTRLIVLSCAALTWVGAAAATPKSWNSDPVGTSMLLTFNHSNLIDVSVLASGLTVTATIDDAPRFTPQALQFTVDLTTLSSYSTRWPQQLESADFFDTAHTPQMSFSATRFQRAGKVWHVYGTLTLHAVSKPVMWTMTNSPLLPYGERTFRGLTLSGDIPWHQFGLIFKDRAGLQNDSEFGDPFHVTFNCELIDGPLPSAAPPAPAS